MVNDSTYLEGNALLPGGSNYIGTPTDYFEFTRNGNLFTKEANTLHTAAHTMIAANKINLLYFNNGTIHFLPKGSYCGNFAITNLAAQTVTFTLAGIVTPEGVEYEVMSLKR